MASDGNDNSTPQFPHLLIPEGEIKKNPKVLTARTPPRDIHHAEHGTTLLNSAIAVERAYRSKESAVPGTVFFKLTLAEDQDFHKQKEAIEKTRLTINAIKSPRVAFVSTSEQDFKRLRERINNYRLYNKNRAEIQYFDEFQPLTAYDKQSPEIRLLLAAESLPDDQLDIQVQVLPNLKGLPYSLAMAHIESLVRSEGGTVEDSPFYISESVPVLHFMMPAEGIAALADDELVYRIEVTPTYDFLTPESEIFDGGDPVLDDTVVIDNLPIVGVIDTGVRFAGVMAPLCVGEWAAPGLQGLNRRHGTMVASRVVFGTMVLDQFRSGVLTPRARVYSILVSDGIRMNGHVLMKNIEAAVAKLAADIQIFNISINSPAHLVSNDNISIFGSLLDSLSLKYGVKFVLSAGNQNEWLNGDELADVFSKQEARVASPGDSYFSLTVGSVVVSPEELEVAPYTRVGPGFAASQKVDLMGEGGGANIGPNGLAVNGQFPAYAVDDLRHIRPVFGTSLAAPVVAGDLADVREVVVDRNLLLAQALLIHTAEAVYDLEAYPSTQTRDWIKQVTGHGLSDPERAKLSTSSSATFVAIGTLNRRTRAEVSFIIPSILKGKRKKRGETHSSAVRLRVTVLCAPPHDAAKGQQYLGGCILTSMHGPNTAGTDNCFNPAGKEGQPEWQPYQHFSVLPHSFTTGDWKLHLELRTRWGAADDLEVPFALAITVEDPTGMQEVYETIRAEAQGRFMPMERTQVRR